MTDKAFVDKQKGRMIAEEYVLLKQISDGTININTVANSGLFFKLGFDVLEDNGTISPQELRVKNYYAAIVCAMWALHDFTKQEKK